MTRHILSIAEILEAGTDQVLAQKAATQALRDVDDVLGALAVLGESAVTRVDDPPDGHEEVVLVAFQTNGRTPLHAQTMLMAALRDLVHESDGVLAWWIAEDERYDRSDCDSAVFVTPGKQAEAARLLFEAGLTPECNLKTPTG